MKGEMWISGFGRKLTGKVLLKQLEALVPSCQLYGGQLPKLYVKFQISRQLLLTN